MQRKKIENVSKLYSLKWGYFESSVFRIRRVEGIVYVKCLTSLKIFESSFKSREHIRKMTSKFRLFKFISDLDIIRCPKSESAY